MRLRKDDLIKPPHQTNEQWLASLLSDKADLLRQIRREIHTRGNQHQKYVDRLDRAIVRARSAPPAACDHDLEQEHDPRKPWGFEAYRCKKCGTKIYNPKYEAV